MARMPQWLRVDRKAMEIQTDAQGRPCIVFTVDLDYALPALEAILVGSPETSSGATTLDRMSQMFAVMV